jgi:hypothetical protein
MRGLPLPLEPTMSKAVRSAFAPLAIALVAILLGSTLRAQSDVCITGLLVPDSGPSICTQRFTHALADTGVRLVSRSLDLNAHNGRLVKVVGREVGVTCRILEVSAVIDPPPATLTLCGTPQSSCPVKLELCPIGMGQGWLFLGLQPDFAPLACGQGFLDGTLLLQSPIALTAFGAGGCGELLLTIPLAHSLQGLQLWFQGARRDIGPIGPLQLTNVVTFRITPFMPPCGPTNC